MKKLTLFATLAIVALTFAACHSHNEEEEEKEYLKFGGTWGAEKIEYYNIDFAGNPIAASMETIDFDPNDTNNGIHLIFKEDKTGEMRDSAIDTVWTEWNSTTQEYESYIVNPDTVLVTTFTYSYIPEESVLYMNMKYSYPYVYSRTFMMKIADMTDNTFIYENEYDVNYIEKAYLKRISDKPMKESSREAATQRPRKPGALMGGR